jgi:hypothetical protein
VQIQVSGSRDLFSFATALRAGSKALGTELDRGLRQAAQIVAVEVLDDPHAQMPSGYRDDFTRSLVVKPEVRLVSSHRISVVGRGVSRAKGRDVQALNRGVLRKPVFGRYRTLKSGSAKRNPWAAQRIRPGWWDDPVDRARPAALRAIDAAVARVVKKIERA